MRERRASSAAGTLCVALAAAACVPEGPSTADAAVALTRAQELGCDEPDLYYHLGALYRDQKLSDRAVSASVTPQPADPTDPNECASVQRTDALSFME